jgi:hypothetical protein
MSKEMTLIVLGVWVIIVPHLGVPTSWKTIIFFLTGAVIAGIGFMLRGQGLSHDTRHHEHQTFVENASHGTNQFTHGERQGINSFN